MGTEGKGQGTDLRTLENLYPWYMPWVFCFVQFRSNVLTSSILIKL